MTRSIGVLLALGAAAAAGACRDVQTAPEQAANNQTLSVAFNTVPQGFTSTENSFNASVAGGPGPWFPPGPFGLLGGPPGPGIGGGFGPMIGGGLSLDFLGGPGLGIDFGHGRFGDPMLNGRSCTYSASTGVTTCTPQSMGGLTIVSTVAFTNAAGDAQQSFDSLTTNTVTTTLSVSGTITRRDSSTTTVSDASDRTVSGLAPGSTQHTVNGSATGSETTNGKDSSGTFTAVRAVGDTTRGVVIPIPTAGAPRTYPIAGTIIREMTATLTVAGQSPATAMRREVVTYDGTNTAQLVITQNGTTKTCTLPLPFGRPTCQ